MKRGDGNANSQLLIMWNGVKGGVTKAVQINVYLEDPDSMPAVWSLVCFQTSKNSHVFIQNHSEVYIGSYDSALMI